MASFYIATRLARDGEHNLVRDILQKAGHKLTYDWTVHGSVKKVSGERLRDVSELEFQGVREADFIVSLLPAGRGTHAELGAGAVLRKPTILHTYPENAALFDPCNATCMAYWPGPTTRVIESSLKKFAQGVVVWWDDLNNHTHPAHPTLSVPPRFAHLIDLPACEDCPIGGRDKHGDRDVPGATCARAPLCDWETYQAAVR